MPVIAATTEKREAFETAVAMARALVIEGTPPAHVAEFWGISEQRLAAMVIQHLGLLMFEAAKVTNAWPDLEAMADGLRPGE